jgi:carbonic anhydrase/acetyltransferase-like protein (isoleucine patch superfamily)
LPQNKDIPLMTSKPPSEARALLLPFDGVEPRFAGPPKFLGGGCSVLGKVEVGAGAVIAAGAVLRGDGHYVRAGDGFSIGQNGTVHIVHDVYPAIIGPRTAIGRNAVVHACTVGSDCVIGDNAVILDGSIVEDNVLVEDGSTVFPKSKLASGFIYAGSPAKQVRTLTPEERGERALRLREAAAAAPALAASAGSQTGAADSAFIARTASLAGRIALGDRSSVFFGCAFDAGHHEIDVGENTNIQDNTRIICSSGAALIGPNVTVGHNVLIHDSRIGGRSLIGIGATVASGTIVEEEVLLAAGAVTLAGQTLESGWLWGGRPARPLARLDNAKRAMMAAIIEHYCAYAQAYKRAQEALVSADPRR